MFPGGIEGTLIGDEAWTHSFVLSRQKSGSGYLIFNKDWEFLAFDEINDQWIWKRFHYEDPSFVSFSTEANARIFYNVIAKPRLKTIDKGVATALRKATLEIRQGNYDQTRYNTLDHQAVPVFGAHEGRVSRLALVQD